MINEVNRHWKNEKKEDIFNMELVRISTAGSVDDGKSTLIGRLLYDNQALTKEQEELVDKKTKEKGWSDLDLSVITDGLVAEREQGITIDVAHIYFSTKTHKFIITDSPGHVEYTRNMVTGASTAETSIILVDARKGLLEQSYRHFYISHLLRLNRVIFCVNKMDLVHYEEDQFLQIAIQIKKMVDQISPNLSYHIIPVSSLKGDNIVHQSEQMPWYTGETLNELLHQQTSTGEKVAPFRFDVQNVYHAQEKEFVDFRGFAGRVISGQISLGDRIVALPSKQESVVTEIRRFTETHHQALAGDSIVISLADEIDVSRGVVLANPERLPSEQNQVKATLVWMDDRVGRKGAKYLFKAGSRAFAVKINEIFQKIDPTQANQAFETDCININDITRVELRLSQPLLLDAYADNKQNGVFVLIDSQSNNTVAVGFVD